MNNPDAVVRGLGDPPPLAIVALDQIVTEGPGVITRPQIDPGLWVKSGQALLDALAAAILASGSLPHPSDPNNREDPSLYRSMRAADIGLMPAVGPTGRTLGARVPLDIPVDADGMVSPGTGGMSVAPFSPANLPSHRRPSSLPGGTSKDPVWSILVTQLGVDLSYRPDPDNLLGHGFVEPSHRMSYAQYEGELESTQGRWQLNP